MANETTSVSQADLLKVQFDASLDLYKNHMELFLKWVTLYLAVVSALVVYIFNEVLDPATRRALPVLIAIGSGVLTFGCFSTWLWVRELEVKVAGIAQQLGLSSVPRFLGKRMTILVMIVTAGFSVVSLLVAIFWTDIITLPAGH